MSDTTTRPTPSRVTDTEAHEMLLRLAADRQPVVLNLDKTTAFLLVTTIQLACRHPGFRATGTYRSMRSLALQVQAELTRDDDVLRRLTEMGWLQEYDVPCGEAQR